MFPNFHCHYPFPTPFLSLLRPGSVYKVPVRGRLTIKLIILVRLCLGDKILVINNLRGVKTYFDSSVLRFLSTVLGSVDSRPRSEGDHHDSEIMWRRRLFTSRQTGRKE
jgi:hypothetical protein